MEDRQSHRPPRSGRLLYSGMDHLGTQMQASNGTIQGLNSNNLWK